MNCYLLILICYCIETNMLSTDRILCRVLLVNIYVNLGLLVMHLIGWHHGLHQLQPERHVNCFDSMEPVGPISAVNTVLDTFLP